MVTVIATIVYNFEVEDSHTYVVGKSQALVHNANANGSCGGNYEPDHFSGFGDSFDDRLPPRRIKDGKPTGTTHGVVTIDGNDIFFKSGIEGPGKRWFNPKQQPNFQSATHVEGHAIGTMIDNGIKNLTITINNRGGPCGKCLTELPNRLPVGSTLNVRWSDKSGAVHNTPIIGHARP